MAAVINPRPSSSAISSFGDSAKPELIQKVDGQLGRITGIHILNEEQGFVVVGEDRTLKVLLKRESGQFWPSTIQDLPIIPTKLICDESSNCIFVGLINGTIYEYTIESDFNSVSFKRQWVPHTGPITGLAYSNKSQQIISCAKDKTIVWNSTETVKKIGSYAIGSPCTAMQFDSDTNFVFVGDYAASIYVLRLLSDNTSQLISKLSAHTGSITDLAWDSQRQFLYSASTDSLVIIWDVGGKRGLCYELNGHNSKLTSLALAVNSQRLFSADDDGKLMCWDMRANRIVAPPWRDSDKCEICDGPFFWNLKVMWDRKVVGARRHHCRTCGMSVCSNCCNNFTVFPAMGFEKPARICKNCNEKMEKYPEQFDLTPLATCSDLRRGITLMNIQEQKGRLVTVGYDRAIMIWNVSKMF